LPIAIAGAIALCQRFFHPLLYVVTVMWIGARLRSRATRATRTSRAVIWACSGNAPS
jgi:hypothetical protein